MASLGGSWMRRSDLTGFLPRSIARLDDDVIVTDLSGRLGRQVQTISGASPTGKAAPSLVPAQRFLLWKARLTPRAALHQCGWPVCLDVPRLLGTPVELNRRRSSTAERKFPELEPTAPTNTNNDGPRGGPSLCVHEEGVEPPCPFETPRITRSRRVAVGARDPAGF